MVYINQMHLFTVYLWRGQVIAGGAKKASAPKKFECKPTQKAQVTADIEAYLKANPVLAKTAEKAK